MKPLKEQNSNCLAFIMREPKPEPKAYEYTGYGESSGLPTEADVMQIAPLGTCKDGLDSGYL